MVGTILTNFLMVVGKLRFLMDGRYDSDEFPDGSQESTLPDGWSV